MRKNYFVIRCRTLLLALLSLPLAAQAAGSRAAERQYLVITSGTDSVAFALHDEPVLSFTGGSLVVSSLADSLVVNMAGVSYFFETRRTPEAGTTGISTVGIPDTQPRIAFAEGIVSGLKAGTSVQVYTSDGILVERVKADERGRAPLSLLQLPKGIYIIKTPATSIKFINR